MLVLTMQPLDSEQDAGSVVTRRMEGYLEAFLEFASVLVAIGCATLRDFDGGESALALAWQDGLRPTAVLSMSDVAAAGVLQAARDLGPVRSCGPERRRL